MQVTLGRYLKHHWRYRQFVHTILGLISGVLTLAAALVILKFLGWHIFTNNMHSVAGIVFLVLCELLVFSGIFSLVLRRVTSTDSETR